MMGPGRLMGHTLVLLASVLVVAATEPTDPRLHDGLLEVRLPPCCATYVPTSPITPVYAEDPEHSRDWMPVVDVLGRACTAGSDDDVYFVGLKPAAQVRAAPANYFYLQPEHDRPVEVVLAAAFPKLHHIQFKIFDSRANGHLTPTGQEYVKEWLHRLYGADCKLHILGEGGYSVAYRVCPVVGPCVVAKVRKISPSSTPGQLIAHLETAVTDLRRDLGVYVIARELVARGLLLDEQGGRHQLARVARFTRPERFSIGIIEQELIALPDTKGLKVALAKVKAGTPGREQAMNQARLALAASPTKAPAEDEVEAFLERFYKTSRYGPDVIKVAAWTRACERLVSIPTIADICAIAKREFRIPDDFDDRLAALEQLYRDTAAEVIRFSRVNFVEATGNHCDDGLVREVGLDYNHGRNVGWEAATGQFVLFDF